MQVFSFRGHNSVYGAKECETELNGFVRELLQENDHDI